MIKLPLERDASELICMSYEPELGNSKVDLDEFEFEFGEFGLICRFYELEWGKSKVDLDERIGRSR